MLSITPEKSFNIEVRRKWLLDMPKTVFKSETMVLQKIYRAGESTRREKPEQRRGKNGQCKVKNILS